MKLVTSSGKKGKNDWDKWDVENAADALIRAQSIKSDPRPGFYAAVKKELVRKVAAANKAAMEAKTTARLHKVFGKVQKVTHYGLHLG